MVSTRRTPGRDGGEFPSTTPSQSGGGAEGFLQNDGNESQATEQQRPINVQQNDEGNGESKAGL
ncbi:hypothetical protein BofuT4_P145400.1 [Botrytis cinerea T4]|uniref:Uncharacterized protein n=1 Tax=Botryotinia fuckeliana (strain T4) TaxID=999810 RepID=G2YYN4_BOTF4|nr:hypothetical protein BofuT4_P145400.1 [Botrytis cinerea T4]